MIGRLLSSADFERVLRTRSCASSTHFAVHHLPERPLPPARRFGPKLSTGSAPLSVVPVDDSVADAPGHAVWLGAVVPKRHARRSVTRSLMKRQIRAAVSGQAALAGGLWVVRLRAPFDKAQFPSAASPTLQRSVRAELDAVLARAAAQR